MARKIRFSTARFFFFCAGTPLTLKLTLLSIPSYIMFFPTRCSNPLQRLPTGRSGVWFSQKASMFVLCVCVYVKRWTTEGQSGKKCTCDFGRSRRTGRGLLCVDELCGSGGKEPTRFVVSEGGLFFRREGGGGEIVPPFCSLATLLEIIVQMNHRT